LIVSATQNLFQISNGSKPCTSGVDFSTYTASLSYYASAPSDAIQTPSPAEAAEADWHEQNAVAASTTTVAAEEWSEVFDDSSGYYYYYNNSTGETTWDDPRGGAAAGADQLRVGFVDVEGQGDESDQYDALLVTPLLLLSKVVVFNWKGGVEKTSILKLLTSLARAASSIDLGNTGDDGHKIFGHLHIVFRDWQYDDDESEDEEDEEDDEDDDEDNAAAPAAAAPPDGPRSAEEKVLARLMTEEAGQADEGITERNATRKQLWKAFASIRVWLFPGE
jgi:hypothetical protein